MQEVWRDVVGFEGFYQISNLGRIKSLSRIDAVGRFIKEKILTPIKHANRYLFVSLYRDGGYKIKSIHRILAEAFIPNPENKPCIDHIDGNKTNNTVSNLRWCTNKENNNNPVTKERLLKANSKCKKRIICIELNRIFDSVNSAAQELSICRAGISQALIGNSKTSGGYHWRYATPEEIAFRKQ